MRSLGSKRPRLRHLYYARGREKVTVKHLRRISLVLVALSALFLAFSLSSPRRVEGTLRFQVQMQAYDALTIYIDPAVDGLNARCDPLELNRPFALYVASNTSARSFIQLFPEGESYYNITLTFDSPRTFQIQIGVFTNNPGAYPGLTARPEGLRYFVEFISGLSESPGSYVISILARARGVESSNPFPIQVPSALNSVIILLLGLLLAYVNLFAIMDAYFKNKSEGISRQRRIGVALLILGSLLFLYWVFGMLRATQPQGVGGIVG